MPGSPSTELPGLCEASHCHRTPHAPSRSTPRRLSLAGRRRKAWTGLNRSQGARGYERHSVPLNASLDASLTPCQATAVALLYHPWSAANVLTR